MADQLQALIDKIRTEAVDKAATEASSIISGAEEKASSIRKAAEDEASAILARAKEAADKEVARGKAALERAARDVLILLGDRTSRLMQQWLVNDVSEALSASELAAVLKPAIEKGLLSGSVEITLSSAQISAVEAALKKHLKDQAANGVVLKTDDAMRGGCRVKFVDQRVELDFSAAAMAEAIVALVHPSLADSIRKAAVSS
jgi:V/A-type H+-transporting ATPase subunit E